MHLRDSRLHGRSIILYRIALLVGRKAGPDIHRTHEREHPNVHLALAVAKRDRSERAIIDRRDMNAASLHEPPAKCDAFRGIVVSAQHERTYLPRGKFHQKIVQHPDRLGRRHRLVVDIARNKHRIGLLAIDSLQDARQYMPLFVEHRVLAYALANVQIGSVDKFHLFLSFPSQFK